jgi:hypothetical protein
MPVESPISQDSVKQRSPFWVPDLPAAFVP